MYLEFYNLKEKPFSLTPDPAFLYYSNSHKRAVAFLKYGLQESKGFLQLTGPIGSGKTTLLRAVLTQLDEKTKTAYIINPCAAFPELLRTIMKDLEIPNIPPTGSKMELLDFFHGYLLVQMKRGCPVVIIIDESQNLSLKNLEEIRMLSNFETSKEKLLQIVFVGQPEMIKTLDLPELRQLKQRIQVRYHLSPLKLHEVKAYIEHRLHVAGSDGEILFTDDACETIYAFSGGIPRLINSVCDIVLLIGYVNERKKFGKEIVEEAIDELGGSFEDREHGPEDEQGDDGEDGDELSEKGDVTKAEAEPPRDYESGVIEENTPPESGVERNSQIETCSGDIPQKKPSNSNNDNHENLPGVTVSNTVVGGLRESRSGSPNRAQGCRKISCTVSSPAETHASDRIREPTAGIFHSMLRHGKTRKFRATGSGIVRLEGTGSVRARIRTFISKCVMGRNGHTPGGPIPKDSPTWEQRNKSERFGSLSVSCGRVDPGNAGRADETAKRTSGNGLHLSDHPKPHGRSAASRAIVTLKNGKEMRGILADLNLNVEVFRFCPVEGEDEGGERGIAFDQIMAIHIAENFAHGPEKRPAPSKGQPKGRQVIVAFANGDVIEGLTLDRFDPDCERFFVVSPDSDGKVSWILVERSGSVGIWTEKYREGIYAEDFQILRHISKLPEKERSPCRHECTGDLYFSLKDYTYALQEYQKALRETPSSDRLRIKISLSHLNLGLKCIRANNLRNAKEEFEKVNANAYLREEALRLLNNIENML